MEQIGLRSLVRASALFYKQIVSTFHDRFMERHAMRARRLNF
jgi:hypothetical protein